MRKLFIVLFIFTFLTSLIPPLHAYTQIPEYLCEIGIKFYQQCRYDEALHEFKKALMVKPDYAPALKYIQMIEQIKPKEKKEQIILPTLKPISPKTPGAIQEMLDLIELQREMIAQRQRIEAAPKILPEVVEIPSKKITPPRIIALDDSLAKMPQPIEIEQGKSIIVLGKNIQRFLVTEPNMIAVEKKSPDELLVTGKEIGYTYLHIWDENGRWTTEWLGVFPRPEGPSYEELMRREEEKARNFKLRYTLSWSSYETGRRVDNLNRSSYLWSHGLLLTGPTPYGDIDSSAMVRSSKTTTDLTYLTLGLSNGQVGSFKGFSLRGFDFAPYFSNLTFPGATLRGGMITSPAFNNKLNYTGFWGREGGGRYGNLSPGLIKTKNSFLDGFNLDYSPTEKQNYKFTLVHGWGRDRDNYLNHYGYDLSSGWNFDKWGLGYEAAYDSEKFGHLLKTRLTQPKLNLAVELRDINKDFNSITGRGWRQGELGSLFNLSYRPVDKIIMNSSLDVYQDRLYPAEDNDNRWNEEFNWDTNYQIDPATNLNLNYTLQNQLGRLSQYRYQSTGLGLSKRIKFIKDISTYANYYHQENKSFSSPSSDYINERFYAGLRFSMIGDLYYYLNKEMNWLNERYTATHSKPNALETGLDWSSQIAKTPFYGNFRFTFRDEENADSTLSFLGGEDYIEGYTELSYRPNSDKEMYGSCRLRNVWADKESVSKRVEVDFNAGMRYLWDTGVHWDSVGNIEGYIFKDLNSDGLRQRDEAPVEGIKLWLGKDKSLVTDLFGYYKFKGVKARKAYVTFDTSTLPVGFVLTVPVTQEVGIMHHCTARIDFGIISRSEISGIVFEDVNGDGTFSRDDLGVQGVVITLEDGTKAVTDNTGKYTFANSSTGEHILSMDLNSLPIYYLPQTSITKKISLFEGVTYQYKIPLKRIKE